MNTDYPREFAFLALVDLPGGTRIHFTNSGWDPVGNQFMGGGGHSTYSVPNNGVSAGTIIVGSTLNLSSAGDQVLAYLGSRTNPTFIAALSNISSNWHFTGSSNSSGLPPGLVDGLTAVAIPEADNIVYDCGLRNGNAGQLLSAINNPLNWIRSNHNHQQLPPCSFTIQQGQPTVRFMLSQDTITEGSGNYRLKVISSEKGNHRVRVQVSNGTASAGSDYSASTFTATFSNSRVFERIVTIQDDATCEQDETVYFLLSNLQGATIHQPSQLMLIIKDNDRQPFLYFQGFDGISRDNWNYSIYPGAYNSFNGWDPQIVSGNSDVWAIIKRFGSFITPAEGSYFWGIQHTDNNGSGGGFWHTMDFDPIDVTGVFNPELLFLYNTHCMGSYDQLEYSVMFDNNSNWSGFKPVSNRNSGRWLSVLEPVPSGTRWVRLRIRARFRDRQSYAGIDNVCVLGSYCANNVTVSTGALPGNYCGGAGVPIWVPFSATGNFYQGNTFKAELSDANGNFNTPTVLGIINQAGVDPSGTIAGTLPSNLSPGGNYRVRVVSSDPAAIGNSVPITISGLSLQFTTSQFSGGVNVSCPGATDGEIKMNVSGGTAPFQYSWALPGGQTATTRNLSNLASGTYQVTVTDSAGCERIGSVDLIEPTLAVSLSPRSPLCSGELNGEMNLSVSGTGNPFNFQWQGPNGFQATTRNLANLGPGSYSVTITDQNGCVEYASGTLFDPPPLTLSLNPRVNPCGHHITCSHGNDGEIDAVAGGGTPPYSYRWSNGQRNQVASRLRKGLQSITVTDANGCQITDTITLTAPPGISSMLSSKMYCRYGVSCHGASDGELTTDVSGGCPPYNLIWSNGVNVNSTGTSVLSGLSGGWYSVTITDMAGCVSTLKLEVKEPAPIMLTAQVKAATCSTSYDGWIALSIAGGCFPEKISWTGPDGFVSNDEDITNLGIGNYTVTVVDSSGCVATKTFVVDENNLTAAMMDCCSDTFICKGDTALLKIELGGQGPWSLGYSDGSRSYFVPVTQSPYYLAVSPDKSTQYELTSVASESTGCTGTVCGRATVGVNYCEAACADPCVNAGVVEVNDFGVCREVTLEVACDTACQYQAGSSCPGNRLLDFNYDPAGNPVPKGTVVDSQWVAWGVTIRVRNNNLSHPQKGVIFDSRNPTPGDEDLGTPNQDFGGPGIGPGGQAGMQGQNDQALGNLIVIAENDIDLDNDGLIDNPDDENAGGQITMEFANPLTVVALNMVDLDNGNGIIEVQNASGQTFTHTIPGLGDNAVATINIQRDSIVELRVILPGSGGVSGLLFCPKGADFVDVSVPCGSLQSYRNNANLPMQVISRDPITGMTGLRVFGLPEYCRLGSGQGPFQIQYTLCLDSLSCSKDFCPPMVAYSHGGCITYEQAASKPVSNGNIFISGPSRGAPPVEGIGTLSLYPNPLQDQGTLEFMLNEQDWVRVALYNVMGHEEKKLFWGRVEAGKLYTLDFEASGLPAGAYLLQLRTLNGSQITKRTIITR